MVTRQRGSRGWLSVDGSQAGTGLSASRIIRTHQLVGAVFTTHYLTHPQLLDLAEEMGASRP